MTAREEVEKHFLSFEKLHEACFNQQADWGELAAYFTDTVDYTDPGWGRMHDRETVTRFLRNSMAGLEAWDFPMQWHVIDGDYVVKKYSMILNGPRKPDGSAYEVSGVYLMHYAGDGKFDYVEDQLNMSHFYEVMKSSGWLPGEGFQVPENVSWD